MYWVNAAETHETFHWESGMRYQVSSRPIPSTNSAFWLPLCPHSYPQSSGERAYGYWLALARAIASDPDLVATAPVGVAF